MAIIGYFDHDKQRNLCPECGRWLVTAGGKRFCAYAEDHKDGVPLFERPAESK